MSSLSISYSSILRVIVVLATLLFLYLLRDIVLIVFVSFVLSAALDPWVNWFERRHLPRAVGILAAYALLFVTLVLIGVALAPNVSEQFKTLTTSLPGYYERLLEKAQIETIAGAEGQTDVINFSETLRSLAGNIIPAVRGVFGGGFTIFLLLVLTFYLSIEDRTLKRLLRGMLPDQYQPYFTRMINRIDQKIGLWFRGQLLLSCIIFFLTAISLFIVHTVTGEVPFWLVLAIVAGILEVIPFLGPAISGIIAVLLVLSSSFPVAVIVASVYVAIQQLENNLLVPKIMQKTVGLNPIVVILVIIIGNRLAGILGALIAIPLAASLTVVFQDIRRGKEALEDENHKPQAPNSND